MTTLDLKLLVMSSVPEKSLEEMTGIYDWIMEEIELREDKDKVVSKETVQ